MMYFFPCRAQSLSEKAVLQEGPLQVAGIPGFGPNRIPALYGRYRVITPSLRERAVPTSRESFRSFGLYVWAVSEPLVFRAGRWSDISLNAAKAREVSLGENRFLVAALASVPVRKEAAMASRWYFILEFDGRLGRDERLRVAEAFIREVVTTFASSRRAEDVNFPATFEVTGI